MSLFSKLRGIMGNLFQIDGPEGNNIKSVSGAFEFLDPAGTTAFVKARMADVPTSSSTLKDGVNLLMARGRIALIEFSFDGGGVVPSPGDNTNKFGICHTTGGGYTAGQVVFDTGTALQVLPDEVACHLTTTTAISGSVSMIANGLYAREGASWVMKGDVVAAYTGLVKSIEVPYAYTDDGTPKLSTASIEAGSRVLRAWNKVKVVFNSGTPSVIVDINGPVTDEVLMAAGDSKVKKLNTYLVEEIVEIDADRAGPVRVTVDKSGSGAGNGIIVVEYVTPFA
jgi:hypothetical protein